MKTAISVEDDVYQEAESTAEQLGLSRSRLYSLALEEFMRNHGPDMVMERVNAVYGAEDSRLDEDIMQAQYDLFAQEDW